MTKINIIYILLILLLLEVGCTQRVQNITVTKKIPRQEVFACLPLIQQYENEYFSIKFPLFWEYDESVEYVEGMEYESRTVDIALTGDSSIILPTIHIVISAFKLGNPLSDIAELARYFNSKKYDNYTCYEEYNAMISGYPSICIFQGYTNGNDTIIGKQFVVKKQTIPLFILLHDLM